MPANSLYDIDNSNTMVSSATIAPTLGHPGGMDESRALSLALDLMHMEGASGLINPLNGYDDQLMVMSDAERANKRSQNMTECVGVPSSEHVAEIVGRQGCKIKALRAKTNTYIKTPVRGEEPVFVVTGRKEDVANAKREILSAADHFSQIRACRKNNLNGSMAPGPPTNMPGHVTISVRVPYRVVGLVVGPKGATIKRIQQQTQTYIVTPSRDKEPVFEVSGMPESVETARKEIEAHIAMRTGSLFDDDPTLIAFATAHNIPMESLTNNADVMNYLRAQAQQSNGLGANSNTSSLNAMLSTNTTGALGNGLNSVGMSNLASGHYNSLANGGMNGSSVANGHSGLNSLSNGFSSLSNGLNSTLGTSSFPSLTNALSGPMTSTMNGFSQNSSMAGMGLEFELNSLSLNGMSNSLGLNGANSYALNNHNQTSSAANQLSDMNPFNYLGETANNLLNAKSVEVPNSSSMLSSLRNGSGFQSTSVANNLPNMYGVDEGLGSLGSSIGSSPALEQSHASQAIWTNDTKFPNPLGSLSFSGSRNFGHLSGENTPTLHISPRLLQSHATLRRSSSDDTHTSFNSHVLGNPSDPNNELQMLSLTAALKVHANSLAAQRNSAQTQIDKFEHTLESGCSAAFQAAVGGAMGAAAAPATSSASLLNTFSSLEETAALDDLTSNIGQISDAMSNRSSNSSRQSPIGTKKESFCQSCQGSDACAVILPCGHNTLCMDCANKLKNEDADCPSCKVKITGAIKLLN